MMYQAGDQQILYDSGRNNPGDILQRKEAGGWVDFEVDGEVVRAPVDLYSLPPGSYRLVVPER